MYGIDISEHQGYLFDLSKYKNMFVIIRGGYWTNVDKCFEIFTKKCDELNIPYGVYWYSYATDVNGAIQEANKCIEVIKGKNVKCGVWIDMEDADHYKQKHGALTSYVCTNVCKAFCETIERAGYRAGIYASRSWFGSFIRDTYGFDKWVAAWGDNSGKEWYDLSAECSIYQYHGAPLDADKMYVPLSWFDIGKKPAEKTVHELAEEVILGKWGNGDDRKKSLEAAGYDYYAVQKEVNNILGSANTSDNKTEVAMDVIKGLYGNGLVRKNKLKQAGYNYDEIQSIVNKLLGC